MAGVNARRASRQRVLRWVVLIVLGQQNLGKAMALGMVVVVAVVMTLYALLQKRTARWLG